MPTTSINAFNLIIFQRRCPRIVCQIFYAGQKDNDRRSSAPKDQAYYRILGHQTDRHWSGLNFTESNSAFTLLSFKLSSRLHTYSTLKSEIWCRLSVTENPKSIKPEFTEVNVQGHGQSENHDSSTILENSGADHRDESKAKLTTSASLSVAGNPPQYQVLTQYLAWYYSWLT